MQTKPRYHTARVWILCKQHATLLDQEVWSRRQNHTHYAYVQACEHTVKISKFVHTSPQFLISDILVRLSILFPSYAQMWKLKTSSTGTRLRKLILSSFSTKIHLMCIKLYVLWIFSNVNIILYVFKKAVHYITQIIDKIVKIEPIKTRTSSTTYTRN